MKPTTKRRPRPKRSRLSAHLRGLRASLGWTQLDVAKRAGIDRSNYVAFETGGKRPGLKALSDLARAYGVKLSHLVDLLPNANGSHGKAN